MKISKKSIAALSITICILSVMSPIADSFWETAQPQDSISAFSKSTDIQEEVTFSADDFTSRLSTGAKLSGIIIDTLPTNGQLCLEGVPLQRGEGVSIYGLDNLSYLPEEESDIANFTFLPVFSTSADRGEPVNVSISVGMTKNAAPKALDVTGETYENIYLELALSATDPENDPMIFKILDAPKLGTAVIENGVLKYTPMEGKKGTDKLTYVATDSLGNSSEPATVKIQIRKNSSKMTYADMDNNPAHLASIKLSQLGIITGEKIGTSYFLNPDEPVTRGEFITMAACGSGLEIKPTLQTDFADDDSIATWVKPYASAAATAGIISGYPGDTEATLLNSDQVITVAEAAVILNNMISLSEDNVQTSAITDNVPAWAVQATKNLSGEGIIKPDEKGEIKPNDPLTKADACRILYAALDYIN